MTVTSTRAHNQLKVYVNGKLHLLIKLTGFIGLQSWIDGTNEYFVECSYSKGAKITMTYGERDIWEKILAVLDSTIE